jgi:hypothetical protein
MTWVSDQDCRAACAHRPPPVAMPTWQKEAKQCFATLEIKVDSPFPA